MDLYTQTKKIMDQFHLKADKGLGQNFLIEEEVILDAISAAEITKEDMVIEIGPGLGTLTQYLLEKAGKVIAIELDERMMTVLQERFFLYSNLEVIHQDVLKTEMKQLIEKQREESNLQSVKIVANLPYYITTPIIMKLLEEKLEIQSITVMVQKEVAQRLTANPGQRESGAITYTVSYYAEAKTVRNVPKECFVPMPSIESSVIQLKVRQQPPIQVNDEKKLFSVIKAAFMQRRKTLLNGLFNAGWGEKEKIEKCIVQLGMDPRVRGEKLTLEEFAELADQL